MNLMQMADDASVDTRDNLMLFGGAALILLGAGMILSNPAVRKYLGALNVNSLLHAAAPGVQRYLKLKAM